MPVVECEPEMMLREDKSVDFCYPLNSPMLADSYPGFSFPNFSVFASGIPLKELN